jgi:hypothetical protein
MAILPRIIKGEAQARLMSDWIGFDSLKKICSKGFGAIGEVLQGARSDHWPISLQWDNKGTPK